MQISSHVFNDLLDSIIVDVASECHRIARLGLDHYLEEEEEELKLSAEAQARATDPSNSGETNAKYVVDIFGQTHPPVANEVFECMNCGASHYGWKICSSFGEMHGKGKLSSVSLSLSMLLT